MKKIWVKRGKVTTKVKTHQEVENPATHHIRGPPCADSCNVRLSCYMKKAHFRVPFLGDDREPCLSRPCSPEGEEGEVTEAEGIDVDDAEGG